MRAVFGGLAAIMMLAVVPSAHAAECARAPVVDRPKIGLVLGGGGARGAAHIGVIRMLEEMRVPVDYVTGTSMGALVGSFYATGMTASELEKTVKDIDFEALFKDATDREDLSYRRKRDDDVGLFGPKLGIGKDSQLLPRGAIHGQRISYLFETLTSQRVQVTDFDDLPIPYRALASDIITSEAVVIGEGNLSAAMRASMSVPGAFDPVEMGDHLLVDGGISNNLPIDVARTLGADIVIAVDVGTPLATREELKNLVNFTAQLSSILVVRNSLAQIATLTERDVLISPALGNDISAAGFDKVGKAIPIGYEAAQKQQGALAQLSLSPEAYAEHRRYIESCVTTTPPIQFVRIENESRFDDSIIAARLHVKIGEPLDPVKFERDIQQIYALGFLDLATYDVVEEDGQAGVVVRVQQDARGTNFIEWGIDLFGDGDDANVNLRLAYLKTDVDRFGSELRILTQVGETPAIGAELYKFIDPNMRIVLKPRVFFERRELPIYNERGNLTDIFDVDQLGTDLRLLHEISRYAAVSAGVRFFEGEAKAQSANAGIPTLNFQGGEYVADVVYDRLDDRYFPRRGSRAEVAYLDSAGSLGADEAYQQVLAGALTAVTSGKHTVFGAARYSTTLNDDAPLYARFRAGGFFNLSGLEYDQITGQHFGMVAASYRYTLTGGGGFYPGYAGLSVEYGNATEQRGDVFEEGLLNGSIYFGYESPLGPLYWGMGLGEGGQRTYFLRVGNVFGRSSIGR